MIIIILKQQQVQTMSFSMGTAVRGWRQGLFENQPPKCIDCFLLAENPNLGLPLIYVTFKSLVLLSYSITLWAEQLILVFLITY